MFFSAKKRYFHSSFAPGFPLGQEGTYFSRRATPELNIWNLNCSKVTRYFEKGLLLFLDKDLHTT